MTTDLQDLRRALDDAWSEADEEDLSMVASHLGDALDAVDKAIRASEATP